MIAFYAVGFLAGAAGACVAVARAGTVSRPSALLAIVAAASGFIAGVSYFALIVRRRLDRTGLL